MSKAAEQLTTAMFQKRWAITLEKIPECSTKTPDFAVSANGVPIATLEVKSLAATYNVLSLEQLSAMSEDEALEAGTQSDNCVSRVATKIHEAAKQLARYDGPKILVLVNDDLSPDHNDLEEALQGYLPYSDGSRVSSLGQRAARDRLEADRQRIDLYIWIDNNEGAPSFRRAYWTGPAGNDVWQTYMASDRKVVG